MNYRVTPFAGKICNPALPLVYGESISYYETLCQMADKLNEVIVWLDGYEDELKAYVDAKYLELLNQVTKDINDFKALVNSQITQMQGEIDAIQDNVDQQLSDMHDYVNGQVADLTNFVNTQIKNLENRVDDKLADNERWVRLQISMLDNKLQLQISELKITIASNLLLAQSYTDVQIAKLIKKIPMFQNVIVVCPVDGRTEPLQDALNHMYQLFRNCAFTALEYDKLGLTAQQWEDLGYTAKEFDDNGLCDMQPEDPAHFAFNGVTGLNTSIRDNIYQLYQLHRVDGLTAQAYDVLDMSAETFDTNVTTAYNYDWTGIAA